MPADDQFSGEVLRPIAAAIVREHPLDGDAVAGEECPGPTPEGDGGRGPFVGMDLGVGQAAVGVDGRMDVGITEAGSTGLTVVGSALLPFTRQPPPLGILACFFTSTWTSSPGRVVSIRRMTRPPLRSRSESRLTP